MHWTRRGRTTCVIHLIPSALHRTESVQLCSQLRVRLEYAKLKVDHGWVSRIVICYPSKLNVVYICVYSNVILLTKSRISTLDILRSDASPRRRPAQVLTLLRQIPWFLRQMFKTRFLLAQTRLQALPMAPHLLLPHLLRIYLLNKAILLQNRLKSFLQQLRLRRHKIRVRCSIAIQLCNSITPST